MPPMTSSAPLIQIMLGKLALPVAQPLAVVPMMKAAEPDARSHP
jgi:hypothetical protein